MPGEWPPNEQQPRDPNWRFGADNALAYGRCTPSPVVCAHDWQPRDDLSIEAPGGGYWSLRTWQCSRCGALDTTRWNPGRFG